MYDYVIVTHIPVFYKVNLYNELSKKLNIHVVFIASNTEEKRSDDFIDIKNINFEHTILFDGDFQTRNQYKSIKNLREIIKNLNYKKVLVSGWDLKEFWYLVFFNEKQKNSLALESTLFESTAVGLKGFIKKVFLSRVSIVFASGDLHVELLKKLTYLSNVKITKGVGIINKPEFLKIPKKYQKNFLYIGRLSKVKNLEVLIDIFNELKGYSLTIVGIGEDEKYLKDKANQNVIFLGSIQNSYLKQIFQENDMLILPSISEPWGLVVEEALYFGLPILVSKNCGSRELVEEGKNGFIINPKNQESIKKKILQIDEKEYEKLLDGVKRFSISDKDKLQVEAYL